ncbi:MAG: alpha-acetolactate decarboxylase, partial [Bacteroidetes bacterium RIFCSPHIGHO2_02_FULL_44_7]
MKQPQTKPITIGLYLLIFSTFNAIAQESNTNVQIVGAMKNVMWKGQLYGNIYLDTIANKEHLYGLGPLDFLTGELLIIDGKSYKSTVMADQSMKVEESFDARAPFFGYTNIHKWTELDLPDNVQNIEQLETFIDNATKSSKRPFMFKLMGEVETAEIHVVNLPKGSNVSSPDEAHKGQVTFPLTNEQVEIVGFFSTEHTAILTHHDTFLHLHLITQNRQKMGHLDKLMLKKGTAKLYLPA